MASFDPVTSVVRALTVLRIVNEIEFASIKQLHKETKLHRSTVLRMLETLISEGYVTRDEQSGMYMPTGKTLLLSKGFDGKRHLSQMASPTMLALRERIGWPSDLAILDGTDMMIIETSREYNIMAINHKAGVRAPLLLTSLGRAYLAFCKAPRQEQLLKMLASSKRSVDAPARDDPKGVAKLLATIRKQGYAVPDVKFNQSSSSGAGLVTGFSVPVFKNDEVFASLSTSFLISAMPLEQGIETLFPALRETADTLGKLISENYS
ncbi:helix-turn-helix domain-containing protein [Sneathiella sp.]|uniref:IclR family transcriptional regulator domain-containing protein n=1 Tax=Sneathiella sp. TaxID=1964365 RepID=UPI0026262829|nr:helix-turn-helix domain-containing protein [Sneathiella sp.]MDF2368509.1 helix-turn-helix domain-containing protein [Sneathiella sp.]|tara:strand:+ start:9669 stop:10463 length:795 start_codon:yes stop_codon:yes gene_type:complete